MGKGQGSKSVSSKKSQDSTMSSAGVKQSSMQKEDITGFGGFLDSATQPTYAKENHSFIVMCRATRSVIART